MNLIWHASDISIIRKKWGDEGTESSYSTLVNKFLDD